jgi:serine carboxypeptidase-like clade 2
VNDFYIAGESYAGHYVPQLAQVIIENNFALNLKGIMSGNPSTDWTVEGNFYFPFLLNHALIGQEEYDQVL